MASYISQLTKCSYQYDDENLFYKIISSQFKHILKSSKSCQYNIILLSEVQFDTSPFHQEETILGLDSLPQVVFSECSQAFVGLDREVANKTYHI